MSKHLLLTGGNGFIGSHTAVKLVEAGYKVTIVDNLSNSKLECIERIKKLSGKPEMVAFYQIDVLDREGLVKIFKENKFDLVIHFAAYKSVSESVQYPLYYYKNNVEVFSSSATVYGDKCPIPAVEDYPTGQGLTNPYGRTKYMMEEILKDVFTADKEFCIILLRYFNPVGAHESGEIGEDPNGIPNNLMPILQKSAIDPNISVKVFGNDYKTRDGTGVRDYIHIQDLAAGHVCAVNWLFKKGGKLLEVFNLGSGRGVSVLEMIKGMEKVCDHEIKYEVVEKRAGDVAEVYCDPKKAFNILGWQAEKTFDEMCIDSWRWISNNPNGY